MKRKEIFQRLNKVFRDIFDDVSITINEATTADDIEDWDSLEHIDLILAVESEFGMKFTIGESTTMHSVGKMIDIILQRAKSCSLHPQSMSPKHRFSGWDTHCGIIPSGTLLSSWKDVFAAGHTPIFVDVDLKNLAMAEKEILLYITEKTRAVF